LGHDLIAEIRSKSMNTEANPPAISNEDAATAATAAHAPKPYSNPYAAGFGLGLVLLAAFLIMGRGLGASGAFTSLVVAVSHSAAPEHAKANEFYAEYLGDGTVSPLMDWLVFEVIGLFAGGLISGVLAGRVRKTIERGPSISGGRRLLFSFVGGALMGIGAKLARGCTSGQALTGGALLGVGSWAFMLAVFGGGYAAAWFVRRQWQ
jgi:uncharacterized membrane protein YedE/YeeE